VGVKLPQKKHKLDAKLVAKLTRNALLHIGWARNWRKTQAGRKVGAKRSLNTQVGREIGAKRKLHA
jgi:hypothetical protein